MIHLITLKKGATLQIGNILFQVMDDVKLETSSEIINMQICDEMKFLIPEQQEKTLFELRKEKYFND